MSHVIPLSPLQENPTPLSDEVEPFGPEEGFVDVRDAEGVTEEEAVVAQRCGEDERDDDVEEAGQRAVPVPSPDTPTREEYLRHCLTHTPYRSWCPHCVKDQR